LFFFVFSELVHFLCSPLFFLQLPKATKPTIGVNFGTMKKMPPFGIPTNIVLPPFTAPTKENLN